MSRSRNKQVTDYVELEGKILELASQGYTKTRIVKELGISKGDYIHVISKTMSEETYDGFLIMLAKSKSDAIKKGWQTRRGETESELEVETEEQEYDEEYDEYEEPLEEVQVKYVEELPKIFAVYDYHYLTSSCSDLMEEFNDFEGRNIILQKTYEKIKSQAGPAAGSVCKAMAVNIYNTAVLEMYKDDEIEDLEIQLVIMLTQLGMDVVLKTSNPQTAILARMKQVNVDYYYVEQDEKLMVTYRVQRKDNVDLSDIDNKLFVFYDTSYLVSKSAGVERLLTDERLIHVVTAQVQSELFNPNHNGKADFNRARYLVPENANKFIVLDTYSQDPSLNKDIDSVIRSTASIVEQLRYSAILLTCDRDFTCNAVKERLPVKFENISVNNGTSNNSNNEKVQKAPSAKAEPLYVDIKDEPYQSLPAELITKVIRTTKGSNPILIPNQYTRVISGQNSTEKKQQKNFNNGSGVPIQTGDYVSFFVDYGQTSRWEEYIITDIVGDYYYLKKNN